MMTGGVCLICCKPYRDDGVWIECLTCQRSYHTECVGLNPFNSSQNNWHCALCTAYGQNGSIPSSINTGNSTIRQLIGQDNKKSNGSKESQIVAKELQSLDEKSLETLLEAIKNIRIPSKQKNEDLKLSEMESSSSILNLNKIFPRSISPLYQGKLFKTGETKKNSCWKKENDEFTDYSHMSEKSTQSKRPERKPKSRYLNSSSESENDEIHKPRRRILQTRSQHNSPNPGTMCSGNDMASLVNIMKKQQLEELPVFTGDDPALWKGFYAQYKSSTEEAGFTDTDNFRRLSKYLDGKAKGLVKNQLVDPSCVQSAINELKTHYGSTGSVVKSLVYNLKKLRSPDMDCVESVLDFRKELNDGFMVLKNLGARSYLENPSIPDEIVDRFPLSLRRKWRQYICQNLRIKDCDVVLEDLVEWVLDTTRWALSENLHQRRRDARPGGPRHRVYMHDEDSQEEPEPEPVAQTNSYDDGTKKKIMCHNCDGISHKIQKCRKFATLSVQKRWEVAKKKQLCYCCLEKWHKGECPVKKECGIEKCDKSHHHLLHKKKPEPEPEMNATMNTIDTKTTYFRVLPVKVYGNGTVIEANAFFDEGSSPTLMTKELAKKLGVSGQQSNLYLSWTDNQVKVEKDSENVVIEISGIEDNSQKFKLRNVKTVSQSHLDLPLPARDVKELQKKCDHLRGLPINEPFNKKPEILIGLEHPKLGVAREVREGNWHEPIATKTPMGWVIHGKSSGLPAGEKAHRICVITESDSEQDLHSAVSKFFTTENFGVKVLNQAMESKEDERAKSLLEATTRDVGGTFETGLLWRDDNLKFNNNRAVAYRRLLCFEKQLEKDPVLAKAVQQKISENLANGYARKLTAEEAAVCSPRTWYLPIFTVKNPHKPTKVRIVYDAAAKFDDMSLNDRLLTGPDLLKSLTSVLWKIREGNVAVSGDIKDMFHRIQIKKEDQDSQRFLWRDCEKSKPPETYILNVMSFGAKCSPTSAQFVKNVNAERFRETHPRAVTSIIDRHYVDDMLDSFNGDEEAIQVCRDVTHIHQQGNFEIRNWVSNSSHVMNTLNGTLSVSQEVPLNLEDEHVDKILGLYWNTKNDTFTFKLSFVRVDPEIVQLKRSPTKREVLKTVMSVFDPLGFASVVTVHAKILLQEIWRRAVEWDQKIPEDLNKQWQAWMISLKKLEAVHIPRCYCKNLFDASEIQLHTFTDASENAFAAVSYLRIKTTTGVQVRFVASKTKVAPKKHLSMPRLELQGALLGARLAETILKEHSIQVTKKFFWTDAQTVLSWIKSDHRRFKQFVANRVSEILDTTKTVEWMWIKSKMNVADEATKPQKNLDLSEDGRWFSGPDFLKMDASQWPVKEWNEENVCSEELRSSRLMVSKELASRYDFIDATRFAKWSRIVRTFGWVLRAKEVFKKLLLIRKIRRSPRNAQVVKPKCPENLSNLVNMIPELTVPEKTDAEHLLLKKIQWESFPEEVMKLQDNHLIAKDSKLRILSPYFDAEIGLVRMRGRIDAAPLISDQFKRPIILCRDHKITNLIMAAYHERFRHVFTENVVNELRQRFWIPQIRTALKLVIKNCQECKIRRATPEVPEMSPLPFQRLAIGEDPFTYTGMDYFGPVLVTVGRHHEKRYGVIFTCLTTRAVHVEVASSLDTNSCIMVVRNFMHRRGPPKEIMSDNGSNLRGAESELRQAIDAIDKNRLTAEGQISLPGFQMTAWRFVTPLASHMAGVWERQVQSIKRVMYACLKERAPIEEVLRSFLIEAEGIVNSRPLTYLPVTIETQEALTPNHFLRMSGKVVFAPGEFEKEHWTRKTWRYTQQLSDEFWRRFVLEYLPEITKRTKWYTDGRAIQVGDLVLLVDENAPRNLWERGIVEILHTGPDKKTRSVSVRTNTTIRKRPVSKLAILDVQPSEK